MSVVSAVSEPHVIRTAVTDRHVVLVHTIGLADNDKALAKARAFIGDRFDEPISDEIKDSEYYLYGKARIRKWLR